MGYIDQDYADHLIKKDVDAIATNGHNEKRLVYHYIVYYGIDDFKIFHNLHASKTCFKFCTHLGQKLTYKWHPMILQASLWNYSYKVTEYGPPY